MPGAVYRLLVLLTTLVEPLPVGTNPGLLHRLWMLASGRLLESRGELVAGEGQTPARGIRAHMHGGYRPVAVDVTALRVWVERRNGSTALGIWGTARTSPAGP